MNSIRSPRGAATIAALALVVAIFGALPAASQPQSGNVTGVVLADNGAGLVGSVVTLTGASGTPSLKVVAGERGVFNVAGLAPGTYVVRAEAPGFAPKTLSPVEVTAGASREVTLVLPVSTVKDSVTVTGPKVDLQPSAELGEAGLASLRPATSDAAGLLRDIPGVSLYSAGGVSSLPAIHGMADDRVRVKVNGMDLVSACPNHMNSPLSYIDPANVASIKVFAGATPVSVGGDSIGGSVEANSAPPAFAQAGQAMLLQGQAGAFYRGIGDGRGTSLSAAVASKTLSLAYNGTITEAGNYSVPKDFKATGTAATGRAVLDGDVVGSSGYRAINHELGVAFRQESHVVELKLGLQNIPYEGFPNQRMDLTGNDSKHGNLRYTGQYRWGVLEARVYDEKTQHSMNFGDQKQFLYGASLNVPGMPMDAEGSNSGALLKADAALSERNSLKAGVEYQRFRLSDWWSPSGGGMAPNTFWNVNDGKRDRLGFFGELETRWNAQWGSHLGVRSDTVMMDTGTVQGYNTMMGQYLAESTAFNARDRQRTDHNWDVTALLRYAPEATQTYAIGISRKTRSPNLYERYAWSTGGMAMVMNNFVGDGNDYVGNLDLKPEVANTASITADWHGAAREWGLTATPYFTEVQDYVDARRCSSKNTNCGATNQIATTGFVYLQYVNQSSRLYGLDVSGRVALARTGNVGSLDAAAVVSYVTGENRTTGDNLYNIMPLNAKLTLEQHLGSWTNTFEAQAVAPKKDLSQVRNEVPTAGYGLLNLRSSYVWKRLRFDLGVGNLLNKFYFQPLGGAYVGQGMTMSGSGVPWGVSVPGPGRSIFAGLSVKV